MVNGRLIAEQLLNHKNEESMRKILALFILLVLSVAALAWGDELCQRKSRYCRGGAKLYGRLLYR